ncbi:MAG: hypothetical protein ACI9ES_001196, partial [Oceanospirillaceae bacterium]
ENISKGNYYNFQVKGLLPFTQLDYLVFIQKRFVARLAQCFEMGSTRCGRLVVPNNDI